MGFPGKHGFEQRSCWVPPEGHEMVGADADGIEFRVLAHYAADYDGGQLADMVLSGLDIHQHNADIAGITRPQAKLALYASLYGATDGKIARSLKVPFIRGREIKNAVLAAVGIDGFIKKLSEHAEMHGWVQGLDGRRLPVRKAHAVLNTAIQGGASVVIKQWTVLLAEQVALQGMDARMMIHQHDEMQWAVWPDNVEEFMSECKVTMCTAGVTLNLNIPVTATPKRGSSWAMTH